MGVTGSGSARFVPGQPMMVRQEWRGLFWAAEPSWVVEDDGETLLEWRPAGSVGCFSTSRGYPGRDHLPRGERQLVSMETCQWLYRWVEEPITTLNIVHTGDWYRTSLGWSPSGDFLGWYVNFQRPLVRHDLGYDTMDLVIDIVVSPDRRWAWKDRDDFEAALERGILDPHVAREADATAEKALADLASGTGPFSPRWLDWRPDPQVGPAKLPGRFDRGLAVPPGTTIPAP